MLYISLYTIPFMFKTNLVLPYNRIKPTKVSGISSSQIKLQRPECNQKERLILSTHQLKPQNNGTFPTSNKSLRKQKRLSVQICQDPSHLDNVKELCPKTSDHPIQNIATEIQGTVFFFLSRCRVETIQVILKLNISHLGKAY